MLVIACTRQPGAEPEPDAPDPESSPIGEPTSDPGVVSREELEARVKWVCERSRAVRASEKPSLDWPEGKDPYLAGCIDGSNPEHPDFQGERWTELKSCMERAQTPDELWACTQADDASPTPVPGGSADD
jgi:hypothetical protein